MHAFGTTPVHGLGLSDADFWASTPREFAARRKCFEQARDFTSRLVAGLQATLHNAHFRHKESDDIFTPNMFLPGYTKKPAVPRPWQQDLAALQKAITPLKQQSVTGSDDNFLMRHSRAAAAQASGASREDVIAIMEGR